VSVFSEGSSSRASQSDSRLPRTAGMFSRGTRPAQNTVRVSQARAALRREARRDEQAVAHWLRELARPGR
jgi:hypothetical protein